MMNHPDVLSKSLIAWHFEQRFWLCKLIYHFMDFCAMKTSRGPHCLMFGTRVGIADGIYKQKILLRTFSFVSLSLCAGHSPSSQQSISDYSKYFNSIHQSKELQTNEILDTGESIAARCTAEIIRFCDKSTCLGVESTFMDYIYSRGSSSSSSSSSSSDENDAYIDCLYGCCANVLKMKLNLQTLAQIMVAKPKKPAKSSGISSITSYDPVLEEKCRDKYCKKEAEEYEKRASKHPKKARKSSAFKRYAHCLYPCVTYFASTQSKYETNVIKPVNEKVHKQKYDKKLEAKLKTNRV
ncbi:hypothetical protein M514_05339 [Trichuris suis]|uniref:Uncharacterized protein n=1 Tax=Trichuris suis TaxID=68888 RepID=A0A085M9D7_9BILA|nr:hypothetical protein M513_05339 [Trichuris suis]KFD71624.1 hypothetical protein M514_05339 [Trichuris suis]